MNLYNCTVNLAGNVLNQVARTDISPAEIAVLRVLHGGDDTIINIVKVRATKRSHAVERQKLEAVYGAPVVTALFGPRAAGSKLPIELETIAAETEDDVPFDVAE